MPRTYPERTYASGFAYAELSFSLCCFPAAPTSVRFWSVSLWLMLLCLRTVPKTPTNNNLASLNTTTSVLFCRYLGAYLIKLGGKIVWLVANFYWGVITLESRRESPPNRKPDKRRSGLCSLSSSFRVWGLVLEGFPSSFSVRLNPWQLSSIVLRPAAKERRSDALSPLVQQRWCDSVW